MEVKKAKKKSSLFRSVSSLSTSSRRQQSETEVSTSDRPLLERIRLSVGRRAVEDYSNHPIAEIWNENENRQSPTNILEPVFDEPTVKPTAPSVVPSDEELPQAVSENNEPNNETFSSPGPSQRSNEEQELIDALKSSSISPRPSLTKISVSLLILIQDKIAHIYRLPLKTQTNLTSWNSQNHPCRHPQQQKVNLQLRTKKPNASFAWRVQKRSFSCPVGILFLVLNALSGLKNALYVEKLLP